MASSLCRIVLACTALLALAPAAGASSVERRLLAEINDYRAARGVKPLRASRSLAASAGRYATHILRTDRLHHHSRVWASRRFSRVGETLAWQMGSSRDARRVVALWRSSPRHRRVLLDRRLRWGGVGREYGRMGSRRSTVWVLHAGAR